MTVKNSQVFVIKTSPKTILEDYKKLMHLANYENFNHKDENIIIKLNLSWSKFFSSMF